MYLPGIFCEVADRNLCSAEAEVEVDKAEKGMVDMVVEVDAAGSVPQFSRAYSNNSYTQSCRYSNMGCSLKKNCFPPDLN